MTIFAVSDFSSRRIERALLREIRAKPRKFPPFTKDSPPPLPPPMQAQKNLPGLPTLLRYICKGGGLLSLLWQSLAQEYTRLETEFKSTLERLRARMETAYTAKEREVKYTFSHSFFLSSPQVRLQASMETVCKVWDVTHISLLFSVSESLSATLRARKIQTGQSVARN